MSVPGTYKIKNADGETIAGPFESRVVATEELERLRGLDEAEAESESGDSKHLDGLHIFPPNA